MHWKFFLRISGWLILGVSLGFLLWGLWPIKKVTKSLSIFPADLQLSMPESNLELSSSNHESRLLTLEYPAFWRVKDTGWVSLILEGSENTSTKSSVDNNNLISEVFIPPSDIFRTHRVWIESRLDINGIDIIPAGLVAQPLLPGEAVIFKWKIHINKADRYTGTAWLRLQFVPLDGNLASTRTISAQQLEIQAISLLGMGGTAGRLVGMIGIIIGSTLCIKIMWKELKRGLRFLRIQRRNDTER